MRFRLSAALLVVLPLLTTGCTKRETPAEEGIRTHTLLIGNQNEPGTLDPQIYDAATDFNVIGALFEGLTTYDEQTATAVPGVAERWEISADGLVYTFHLRANARWSNGDPLTARDFAWSFQRFITPALGNSYAYYLYPVRGAEDFATGKTTDFSRVGVEVIDDLTLRITRARPAGNSPSAASQVTDLPQPLSPTSPIASPGITSRSMPRSAGTPSNATCKPRKETSGRGPSDIPIARPEIHQEGLRRAPTQRALFAGEIRRLMQHGIGRVLHLQNGQQPAHGGAAALLIHIGLQHLNGGKGLLIRPFIGRRVAAIAAPDAGHIRDRISDKHRARPIAHRAGGPGLLHLGPVLAHLQRDIQPRRPPVFHQHLGGGGLRRVIIVQHAIRDGLAAITRRPHQSPRLGQIKTRLRPIRQIHIGRARQT